MKFPIPKEHGAWAMLYAPFLIAIAALGSFSLPAFLFLLTFTAFFFAHAPLFVLVRLNPEQPDSAGKFRESRTAAVAFFAVAGIAGSALLYFYERWYLIPAGAVLGLFLAVQTYLTAKKSEKSMAGELLAVLSLTSTAPFTWYSSTGEFGFRSVLLWILCILYFISSIFFVKLLVGQASRKKSVATLVRQCAAYHIFLLPGVGLLLYTCQLPWIVLPGFVPVVIRAFWISFHPPEKLNLKKVGLTEMAYTLVFALMLSLGFACASP